MEDIPHIAPFRTRYKTAPQSSHRICPAPDCLPAEEVLVDDHKDCRHKTVYPTLFAATHIVPFGTLSMSLAEPLRRSQQALFSMFDAGLAALLRQSTVCALCRTCSMKHTLSHCRYPFRRFSARKHNRPIGRAPSGMSGAK